MSLSRSHRVNAEAQPDKFAGLRWLVAEIRLLGPAIEAAGKDITEEAINIEHGRMARDLPPMLEHAKRLVAQAVVLSKSLHDTLEKHQAMEGAGNVER